MYHYSASWWPVFIFGVKITIMVLTTVTGRIWGGCVFVIPLFYVFVVLVFRFKMPYISALNNRLSVILYSLNAVFSLVPVLERLEIPVPGTVVLVFSVLLTTVPIVIIIGLFCCQSSAVEADDPTRPIQRPRKITGNYTEDQHEPVIPQPSDDARTELLLDDPAPPALRTFRSLHMDALLQDAAGDLGQPVTIPERCMDTIVEWEFAEARGMPRSPPFEVGQRAIALRVRKLYQVVDRVIDGSTIELLTRGLNAAMFAGAIAFGWYVGALRGTSMLRTAVVCT
jgi:hypothetical protein